MPFKKFEEPLGVSKPGATSDGVKLVRLACGVESIDFSAKESSDAIESYSVVSTGVLRSSRNECTVRSSQLSSGIIATLPSTCAYNYRM